MSTQTLSNPSYSDDFEGYPEQGKQSHGNKCGHDPKKPKKCLTYDQEREKIKKGQRKDFTKFQKLGFALIITVFKQRDHPLWTTILKANPELRRNKSKRSDFREACYIYLMHITIYLDISSLTIGRPDITKRGGYDCQSHKEVAEATGLNISRIENVVKALKACSFLWVEQQKDWRLVNLNITTHPTAFVAIKRLTNKFLICLGFDQKYVDHRRKIAKPRADREKQKQRADLYKANRREEKQRDAMEKAGNEGIEDAQFRKNKEILKKENRQSAITRVADAFEAQEQERLNVQEQSLQEWVNYHPERPPPDPGDDDH